MKISHVAIGCSDLEKVTAFYVETLGFKEAFRLERPDSPLGIVYIDAGPDCFIELLERDADPVERVGLAHICLEVEDLEGELERLAGLGVKAEGPINQGCDGNLQAWVADPEGNRLELMQLMPEGRQRTYRAG
ncbi:MAG: VOC family protein [Planctomycetota bacterium]|jgi:lactoylglutathione lyase